MVWGKCLACHVCGKAMYCQIVRPLSQKKKKKSEGGKKRQVQCVSTNPDISFARMGIGVRLSRFVFGVVSPSWRGVLQGQALWMGSVNQMDMARTWQIFSTTVLKLHCRVLFQSVENLYFNVLLGKTEYGLQSSHPSSRWVTRKHPYIIMFPKSKESSSVGCSYRNELHCWYRYEQGSLQGHWLLSLVWLLRPNL